MAKEGLIRIVHIPLMGLIFLTGLITLGISAHLVSDWNSNGYPNTSIRDRSRVCLVFAIFTCVASLYCGVGSAFFSGSLAFGLLVHLVTLLISFLLGLIGAAAITASVTNVDCGDVDWSHCNLTKGLQVIAWITTILVFVSLIFIAGLSIKARSGSGIRRGTITTA